MSLMELEFGFKKKYILARYGDLCNHCLRNAARIYFEGNDLTTFVLCEECLLSVLRILAQDWISAAYPDVNRKTLVEMGIADQFMQRLCDDVKRAMSGS